MFRMVANAVDHFLRRNFANADSVDGHEQRETLQLTLQLEHLVDLQTVQNIQFDSGGLRDEQVEAVVN